MFLYTNIGMWSNSYKPYKPLVPMIIYFIHRMSCVIRLPLKSFEKPTQNKENRLITLFNYSIKSAGVLILISLAVGTGHNFPNR
jgi:hypothetical protein